jgi:hypothetical protein
MDRWKLIERFWIKMDLSCDGYIEKWFSLIRLALEALLIYGHRLTDIKLKWIAISID